MIQCIVAEEWCLESDRHVWEMEAWWDVVFYFFKDDAPLPLSPSLLLLSEECRGSRCCLSTTADTHIPVQTLHFYDQEYRHTQKPQFYSVNVELLLYSWSNVWSDTHSVSSFVCARSNVNVCFCLLAPWCKVKSFIRDRWGISIIFLWADLNQMFYHWS